MHIELSIVIAAFNEEVRLPMTLRKIHGYVTSRKLTSEIIVVDDGSSDGTAGLTEALSGDIPELRLISYPQNRGKGHALRTGVLASRGGLVLLTDADLSTPIEELERLRPFIDNGSCHVAIGSRALAMSRITKRQPWWRQGMGKIFNRFVKALVINDYSDTQCGFKLFTGETARSLFSKAHIDRFAYDVEILALAKKNGYRVAEVPIEWINAPGSKVHPVEDSLQMLKDLCRIRLTIGAQNKTTDHGNLRNKTVILKTGLSDVLDIKKGSVDFD
ncbi:glycosyl transferase [Geobacter sp. AOG1]|nr:glycosyl transferase [Geobacter sp. AOG1]